MQLSDLDATRGYKVTQIDASITFQLITWLVTYELTLVSSAFCVIQFPSSQEISVKERYIVPTSLEHHLNYDKDKVL